LQRAWGLLGLWVCVLLFALSTGRELAFNLLYFISGVILLALAWSWANLRGLSVHRAARGQRTQVGHYFEESLTLSNASRWPKLWVEVLDASDLPGHQVSRVVSSLRAHASSRWHVRTMARRRGRFMLGPLTLTSGDPLGLFRFSQNTDATTALVVTPSVVDVPDFSPPTGYLAGGELMHLRTPYVTTSTAGVRDYVPGDSLNRVHWLSTARTGRLISKEFELDPLADVWIFLDMHDEVQVEADGGSEEGAHVRAENAWPWPGMGEFKVPLPRSTTEYAVTIAASLAQHFLRHDRSVGFLSYAGEREFLQPDRGRRQLDRLMELLAVIQAEGEIPLAQVLASEGVRLARHSTLVVITPSIDPAWVGALRGLGARGVHGIAILLAAGTFLDHPIGDEPLDDWHPALVELQATGLPTYPIRYGDDLAEALTQFNRPRAGRRWQG